MGAGASGPTNTSTHVVIIGGGYAGTALGRRLMKVCKVTLIDPKDSMVHNIGALRACVSSDKFASKVFIPYAPTFGESFVRGKVVKIDKALNSIILEDGREISYTHLVVATGYASPFPGKITKDYPDVSKTKGVDLYKNVNQQIQDAQRIVCVGGGAVGVELAGEIKGKFPAKDVTLVHSSEFLCSPKMNQKTQKNLQKAMKAMGISLVLKERVSNLGELKMNEVVKDQILKTESGQEIPADLIFPCTGLEAGTNIFKGDLGDAITDKGDLKVDKHFLVQGSTNIYAIGDIAGTGEEKMAATAGYHASHVAKVLKSQIKGSEMIKPYKKVEQFVMMVPLGTVSGVGEYNGHIFGSFAVKMIKGKDLFTSRFWSEMNQKPN